MHIAIGTKREAKIVGLKKGIKECVYVNEADVEYSEHEVSSGINHMPLSLTEIMNGARNRAENMLAENIMADYYVGMEGGFVQDGGRVFLVSLVYVMNNNKVGHFGLSPMLEVPPKIREMVIEEGKELGPLMGELSGNVHTRSENGSMGAWSNDMFTRSDEFAVAIKAAFVPFYNEYYKLT